MDVEVGEDVDDAGPASGFSLSGWLEKMLRELPFPCGLAPIWLVGGPAVDSTATGIGCLRNLPTGLLFDDQCTSSRAEIYFTISGHDSFPSPLTRHIETWETSSDIFCTTQEHRRLYGNGRDVAPAGITTRFSLSSGY